MRVARASGLLAFMALSVTSTQAEATCYKDPVSIDANLGYVDMLRDISSGSITSFCSEARQSKDIEPIAYPIGNIVISVLRRDTVQPLNDCRSVLDNIVSGCILGIYTVGGALTDEYGVLYKVSQSSIEARSPAKSKPQKSKPQPNPKPQISAPKPDQKPQAPTPKPENTPVNQRSKTSSALAPLKPMQADLQGAASRG